MNMADLDRVAVRVSDGLRKTLSRINALAVGIVGITATIGLATFLLPACGSSTEANRPGPSSVAPCASLRRSPALFGLVLRPHDRQSCPRSGRTTYGECSTSRTRANVLINYDTGERLTNTAQTSATCRIDLRQQAAQGVAGAVGGVRAITSVPGLVAIALLGTLTVGALGTILLIGGLID